MNSKGRLFKKQTNAATKPPKNMQICNHKQTNPKSARKSDLGGSWGSIWEGFGTLRAVMGPLLGAFWLLVGRSNSYLLKTWVQDGLQEVF